MEIRTIAPFGALIKISQIDDISPATVKILLEEKKLVLIRGLQPLNEQSFLDFVLSLTPADKDIRERLLHWEFGPVAELKQSGTDGGYLTSNSNVPFHWDGAFHREPSYLAFNCIQAPLKDGGGETLFSLTERIYDDLDFDERSDLSRIHLTYTAKDALRRVTLPMIQKHPRNGRPILRYAEPVATDLSPVAVAVGGLDDRRVDAFVSAMSRKIYDERYCYQHRWEDGDILLVDNFSTIHGRKSFVKYSPRHIRRIQVV